MNITGPQQGLFWASVKDTVKCMIEKQHTNATSGSKKTFIGRLLSNDSIIDDNA
jgi:hypothetical protein